MDALYFRVSSERQTTENQFEDLIQVAEKDGSVRNWVVIRERLSQCILEEQLPSGRLAYRVKPEVLVELTRDCIYVEQGRSGKVGAKRRPLFEQMKRDGVLRKFDRLLVWKVSRLGRDMREVISTVYELSDLDITVVPIKSQTGPINSVMGKLLWAIQAWFAEMENGERSEAIRAGQARARAEGKHLGRPRAILDATEAARLRQQGQSWRKIAATLGVGTGTVRRAYQSLAGPSDDCQH